MATEVRIVKNPFQYESSDRIGPGWRRGIQYRPLFPLQANLPSFRE